MCFYFCFTFQKPLPHHTDVAPGSICFLGVMIEEKPGCRTPFAIFRRSVCINYPNFPYIPTHPLFLFFFLLVIPLFFPKLFHNQYLIWTSKGCHEWAKSWFYLSILYRRTEAQKGEVMNPRFRKEWGQNREQTPHLTLKPAHLLLNLCIQTSQGISSH